MYTFCKSKSIFTYHRLLNNKKNRFNPICTFRLSTSFAKKQASSFLSLQKLNDNTTKSLRTTDDICRHTPTRTTMYYDQTKLQLIFLSYRSNAQPMDDFLMTDDENKNYIKYVTSKQ